MIRPRFPHLSYPAWRQRFVVLGGEAAEANSLSRRVEVSETMQTPFA
jgi:hypothetical protein